MTLIHTDKQEMAAEVMAFAADISGSDMGSYDLAEILAMAYGAACGMHGLTGVGQEAFERLNEMATQEAFEMAKSICVQAGAGRA